MKLRVVHKKISNYVRYDLKEIVWPSPLPDPPNYKPPRKLTWKERFFVSSPRFVKLSHFYSDRFLWCCSLLFFNCVGQINICCSIFLCVYVHMLLRHVVCWQVLKEACRVYAASWVRDIGPDLRPEDYKKKEESDDGSNGGKGASKERELSTLEDLGNGYLI